MAVISEVERPGSNTPDIVTVVASAILGNDIARKTLAGICLAGAIYVGWGRFGECPVDHFTQKCIPQAKVTESLKIMAGYGSKTSTPLSFMNIEQAADVKDSYIEFLEKRAKKPWWQDFGEAVFIVIGGGVSLYTILPGKKVN